MDPESMIEPRESFWDEAVVHLYLAPKRSVETLGDHVPLEMGFFLTFPGLLYHPRPYQDTQGKIAIGATYCRVQGKKKTFW